MPGVRTLARDQNSDLYLFADWVAAEDHFSRGAGSGVSRAAPEPLSTTSVLRAPSARRRGELSVSALPSQSQVFPLRTFSDAITQTDVEAPAAAAPLPSEPLQGGGSFRALQGPASAEYSAITPGPAQLSTASYLLATALAEATPQYLGLASPNSLPEEQADPSAAHGAVPAAPVTPLAEPPNPPVSAQAAVRESRRSGPAERTPRTRSQVGRDSYQLLWREYLTLTEQQQQQQRTAARRGLVGWNSNNNINATAVGHEAEMSSMVLSTILHGPQPCDTPKGLSALLLLILCPPTDFVDMQKLTKLLIRVIVGVSVWLAVLSFAIIPAWLWLLRHELIQGHNGDAAVLLLAGLVVFMAGDVIQVAASRMDSASRAGVFVASDRAAYQLSLGRQDAVGASGAVARAAAGAAAVCAGEPPVTAPDSASTPFALAHSHPNGVVNGVDPLVSQVKQRIIDLERFLFGHTLTEADISRDTLGNRVHMLCTEVGVPFGGPGGSSSRPTAAELDQQLQAVEKALGVI